MPRSRSHSTSSLPGNLMDSWSIHSYPAPRVEATVEDSFPNTLYSSGEQKTHEQPNEEIILPVGPGSMQLSPQYTIPPVLVDTAVTQDNHLPSFADLQRSLMIPTMPPPTYMNHLPPTQLPSSGPVADRYSGPLFITRRLAYNNMFHYWLSVPRARRCVSF